MPVAKCYENEKILDQQPYLKYGVPHVRIFRVCPFCNGTGQRKIAEYVQIKCQRCKGRGKEILEVRWYSDADRAMEDRAVARRAEVKMKAKELENTFKFNARKGFGFGEEGFITLFKGKSEEINNWRESLPRHSVMQNELFGWYAPSHAIIANIPAGVETYVLNWSDICKNENELKEEKEVKLFIHNMLYGESKSQFQGQVGDWLEKHVKVIKNIELNSVYSKTHQHIMEDDDGNIYSWSTSAKSFAENSEHNLKMKVKDHKEDDGILQTVVYYCKEK